MKSTLKSKQRFSPLPSPSKKPAISTRPKRAKTTTAPDSFYDEFKQFLGIIKDGPADLAKNHKLYANGTKKWK